ncbi:MAG: hypothetical protein KDD37_04235 [Bdellovibrionales bacterium]|nr:hypothetical protein [Bdellovibrionales bacterium]
MQARIRKSKQIISVDLIGKVDYETLEGFIDLCRHELKGNNIVFNLEALSFVGSCGVTNFLNILANLQRVPMTRIKYVCMAKEFVKLFQSMEETKQVPLALYLTEFEAVKSFETPDVVVASESETATVPHELNHQDLES